MYRDDLERASELVGLFALSQRDNERAALLLRLSNRLGMHARGAEVADMNATILRLVRVVRDLRERCATAGLAVNAPSDSGHGTPLTRQQWDAVAAWLWQGVPAAPPKPLTP